MSILLSKIGDYVDGSDQMGKFICPAFNNDRIFSYQKKGDKKKLVESTHKKKKKKKNNRPEMEHKVRLPHYLMHIVHILQII